MASDRMALAKAANDSLSLALDLIAETYGEWSPEHRMRFSDRRASEAIEGIETARRILAAFRESSAGEMRDDSERVPPGLGSCRSGDAADASSSLRDGDPSRAAALTPEIARTAYKALEPFHRANRAVGDDPYPVRFYTDTGYREVYREELRAASEAYRQLRAALCASDKQPKAEDAKRLSPKGASAVGEAEAPQSPGETP